MTTPTGTEAAMNYRKYPDEKPSEGQVVLWFKVETVRTFPNRKKTIHKSVELAKFNGRGFSTLDHYSLSDPTHWVAIQFPDVASD